MVGAALFASSRQTVNATLYAQMTPREDSEPDFGKIASRNALRHWPLESLEFVRWFENVVYSAEWHDARVYLRVTPSSRRTLAEIESEIAILEYLNKEGFPANYPIPTERGDLIAVEGFGDRQYFVSVFSECLGKEYLVDPTGNDFCFHRSCGKAMGQLHELLRTYQSITIHSRPSWRFDRWSSFPEIVPQSDEIAWSECEEMTNWWRNLEKLGNTQLIHGDFTIKNLRYFDDHVSLFDFDGCCEHYIGYEIGCYLHHFRNIPHENRSRLISNFLEGYSEASNLNEETVKAIPQFCKMKLLRSFLVLHEEMRSLEVRDQLRDIVMHRREELSRPSVWKATMGV